MIAPIYFEIFYYMVRRIIKKTSIALSRHIRVDVGVSLNFYKKNIVWLLDRRLLDKVSYDALNTSV